MSDHDQETIQKIDPYVLLVIKTTSTETAKATVDEHEKRCTIHKLSDEVWGNDKKNGLKIDVWDVFHRVAQLEQCKKSVKSFFIDKILGPALACGVVLLIGWLVSR